MEQINVSEIRKYLGRMQIDLEIVLHALDTKILVGEINRPADMVIKIRRKRRTKKEMEARKHTPSMRNPPPSPMNLEKEYQAGRTSPILSEANRIGNLPDADANNPFYAKPKKEKKKRGKKIDGGE